MTWQQIKQGLNFGWDHLDNKYVNISINQRQVKISTRKKLIRMIKQKFGKATLASVSRSFNRRVNI